MRAILDTSALLTGGYPEMEEMFTTPDVIRELEAKGMTFELRSFIDMKVGVVSPSREGIDRVMEASLVSGDSERLSPTDVGLLALALDEDAVLITDDYSMQNLAEILGIEYRGVMFPKITKRVSWRYRCEGCGRRYEEHSEVCDVCGARLRTYRKDELEIEKQK
jgi:UPF0271 protein